MTWFEWADKSLRAEVSPQDSPEVHDVARIGRDMITLDVTMRGFKCEATLTYRPWGIGRRPDTPPEHIIKAAESWITHYHLSMTWPEYINKLFNTDA